MAAARTYLWILIFVATSWRIQGAPELSCHFEEGLCDWYNNGTAEMQWRLGSGQTDDRTSGPLNDHTCNSVAGRYLYIVGEDAVDRASVAVIKSDFISLSKESHFSFWYHMNGFATGNLTLYRIHGNTSTPLWSRSGRQGKTWTQGLVTLTPGRLALRFEATVKLPIGSDLALDDLDLSSEHHEKNKSHCAIQSTARPSSTSDFRTGSSTTRSDNSSLTKASGQETTAESSNTAHTTGQSNEPTTAAVVTNGPPCFDLLDNPVVLPGTCDFENGTCGIHIVGNDSDTSISWNRTNQQYGGSLILGDHTFLEEPGRGYYMDFFKGTAFFFLNSQSTANLETPVLVSDLVCLSFWYSAPNQYSNLLVLVRGEDEKEIWNMADEGKPKVSGWQRAEVQISESYPFTIVFQSQKNYFAVVGIDDIIIQGRGSTSSSSTSVVPKPPLSSMSPLPSKVTPKLHTTSSTANVLSTNGETLSPTATNMPLSPSKSPTPLVLSTITAVKTLSTVVGQSSTTILPTTPTVTEAATVSPTFSTITSRILPATYALVTSTPPQFKSSSTATGQSSSTGIMSATTVTETVTAAPTFSTTISRTLSASTTSERSSQVFTVTSNNTTSSLFTSQTTSSGLKYNATVTSDFVPTEKNVTAASVSTTTSKPVKTTKLPDGTKKPYQSTKNPLKTADDKSEEQTGEESDDNKHVTVIVGFSVGGALTVVLILVIVYVIARCFVASRRSRKLTKGGQLMSNFGSSNTVKGRQLDFSADRQMEQIGHDKDIFCMYNNHLNGNINQNCIDAKAAGETNPNGVLPSGFETNMSNGFDNALITRL